LRIAGIFRPLRPGRKFHYRRVGRVVEGARLESV
jgi:hypothetical protein